MKWSMYLAMKIYTQQPDAIEVKPKQEIEDCTIHNFSIKTPKSYKALKIKAYPNNELGLDLGENILYYSDFKKIYLEEPERWDIAFQNFHSNQAEKAAYI